MSSEPSVLQEFRALTIPAVNVACVWQRSPHDNSNWVNSTFETPHVQT